VSRPTLAAAHVAAILRRVAASRPRQVGDYGWCGSTCLQCVAIDEHDSHHEEPVARYDADSQTSRCPTCGALVPWEHAPWPHDDPRCEACRECPPTLPSGCPSLASGSRSVAGGGPSHQE